MQRPEIVAKNAQIQRLLAVARQNPYVGTKEDGQTWFLVTSQKG